MSNELHFNGDQLNRLFPFYIRVNHQLMISGFGNSLSKFCPVQKDRSFTDFFEINRPHTAINSFVDLVQLRGQLVIINKKDDAQSVLKGQFEDLADGELLFVGSPWFNNIEQVTANGLTFKDFASHDPLIDMLHVLKAQEIVNADLKQLLHTVHLQKRQLKEADDEIKNMAALAMNSPNPVCRISLDGFVLMKNPIADGLDNFVYEGKTYSAKEFWVTIMAQKPQNEQKWSFEAEADNKFFVFTATLFTQLGYANVYATDITKIKFTETELEQRVLQFKSLSENIPGVIYEYEFRADGTDGLRYVSPAIERVFGINRDDFIDYRRYIHPDDRAKIAAKNQHSRDTLEPFYDESRLVTPGGVVKWHALHSSYSYTTQNGSKVFTGFIMDITDRKNTEDKLRANEEKYRNIIANMNLGLLEVDNSGLITYANQSFCTLSGYTTTELIGQPAASLLLTPQSFDVVEEKLEMRKNGIADAYEVKARSKDGQERWWLISGAPRFDDKGNLVGSIGIHLDISLQKQQESELIEARIQAEHLARTKEIFLANMSHEIRTPMNAIMGMSNQLAKTSLVPRQKFFLDTILAATENLLVIINDILDLSKIDAGKLSFENIGFEPKVLIKNVMQVMGLRAEEKGIKLTSSDFEGEISPVLMGDPFRLNQILLNLTGNAIKFTEKGYVDIKLKLVKNNNDWQTLSISVKDSGIGMDEAFVKHLFDKFSQEHENTTRKYGGTGLGMSISKQLVEMMGGTISAQSQKGVGTTITIELTFKRGSKADLPEQKIDTISGAFLAGKKVLLTDDNELNRLVASIILENNHAVVTQASDGEQAATIATAQEFDVILMDVQMPGLNGLEATQLLRERGNNVPILALTAGAVKGEREKCIEAGMNDYISKPFKEQDFLQVLNRWVKKEETVMAEENNYYDLTELRTISRGNDAFVKKMCIMFYEQTPGLMAEMVDSYKQGNLKHMGEVAHKIKPSINSMHINDLKEIILMIEKAGKEEQDSVRLPGLLKHTQETLNVVVEMLQKEFPQ